MALIETFTIDSRLVSALGWTLIHFIWQGLALAIVLRLALPLLHGALARYNAAVAAMGLMAVAPLVTFWKLYSQAPQNEATSGLQGAGTIAAETINLALASVSGSATAAIPQGFHWSRADAAPLCVAVWLVGVALLSLRSLGGWLIVRRLRRQCALLPNELRDLCVDLCKRLGMRRPIGFFEARGVDAPAVIGWFKPIVLLPLSALTGLDTVQLEAVIAHELAHIKRHDAFVNLFQIAMETVLFYHPAIWWTSRLIRHERELCCDDVAVAVSGQALPYAKALALMEEWRQMPQFALAVNSQPLKSRIARLLGASSQVAARFPAPTMLLMLVLATTSAALLTRPLLSKTLSETVNIIHEHLVPASTEPAGTAEQTAAVQTPLAQRPLVQESATQEPVAQTPVAQAPLVQTDDSAGFPAPVALTAPVPAALAAPAPVPAPAPAPRPAPTVRVAVVAAPAFDFSAQDSQESSASGNHGSYIAEMEKAGFKDLTIDQLVELKVQGVTADYVQQMRTAGLSPTVHEIVALKVQGVTPDYIRQMQAAGFKTDIHAIISMKVQGITPEYVKEIRASGLNPSTEELVGMKIQGVTPQYVQEVRSAGWPSATVRDVIGMKIQGVSPSDAAEFRKLGFQEITLHDLIGLKIQGVTPAYIEAMRAAGAKTESIHEYMGAKIQGVTPEYLQEVRSAGYPSASLRDVVGMKIQGVSPSDAAAYTKLGFQNVTLHDLMGLKIQGVTPAYVEAMRAAGLKSDSLHQYMEAKIQGVTPEFAEKARQHGFKDLDLHKLIALKMADVL